MSEVIRQGFHVAARRVLPLALALCAGATAAQPSTWYSGRDGPYLLAAAGGSQYEYDCAGYYYYANCSYGRAGAGKLGLGYRFFGRFGVEGTWTDFGRARIESGRTPRDSLRMQALGVNAVFSIPFGPASEGLLRVGLADVRHSRSDDVGAQHVFNASVGLAFLLHLGPHAALEIGWDATSADGRNAGTTVAGAVLAGLRWSF